MNRTYNLHRLNGFYTFNTKTVFEFSGLKKYYSTGAIEKDNFEYVSYENRPSRANLQPEEGCLIFAKMSNTTKTIYIDNELKENIYSTGFFSIKPKNINYEYLFYLLECTEFLQEKDSYSNGTTQISINENNLKKIKVHLTTFKDEQTRIVKAIKSKEEKINALITNEQKQIEKLKAYKQALISEVVTKGLDPNVPMKDSGVEWIGKIPANWSVAILKSFFKEHKNKNKNMRERNLLSLSYGNIVRKDINSNDGLLPWSFEGYNIVEPGFIVLRLTDLQNDKKSLRTGLVNERGIITSAYVSLSPRTNVNSYYYQFYFIPMI